MNLLNKLKTKLKQAQPIDDDKFVIDYSDMLDKMMEDIGEPKIPEELIPKAINTYDDAISTFQKYLDLQFRLTQSWMNVLITVQKSATMHREFCDKAKQIFLK